MNFGPQDALWIAVFIGLLIFVHELGHFVVAKAFDIKVVRFSIGFGPRLLSWNHGETEYCLCALPLGGYVKMVGQLPGEDIPAEDRARAFANKSITARALVAFAGPGFNFLLAILVYFGLAYGDRMFGQPKLGIVGYNSPAWAAGLRPGDEITAVNGVPVGEWQQLRTLVGGQGEVDLPMTITRDGTSRVIHVRPKTQTELDGLRQEARNGRIGVINRYVEPVLAVIDGESPAARAGLRTGDRITHVNGMEVQAWYEVRAAVAALRNPAEPLQLRVERPIQPDAPDAVVARTGDGVTDDASAPIDPPTKNLTATLLPQQMPLALQAIPPDLPSTADWGGDGPRYTGLVSADTVLDKVEGETSADLIGLRPGDRMLRLATHSTAAGSWSKWVGTWAIGMSDLVGAFASSRFTLTYQRGSDVLEHELELIQQEVTDEFKDTQQRYVFGGVPHNRLLGVYTFTRAVGPAEAAAEALADTGRSMTLLLRVIRLKVSGDLPEASMTGPIGLGYMAAKAARMSLATYFGMMAFFSINLGLMNLLPVPVLDGGHLLFCLLEAVQRRKPSLRTMERAYTVGFVLLILLMAFVITKDFSKYILG